MYVCVCFAVTDVEVRAAIADGASSVGEVTRACRAGGDCGSCHGMIETMLEDAHQSADATGPIVRSTTAASATPAELVPASALLRKTG